MAKLVVLKLGDGDWQHGFSVTLQIGEEGERPSIEVNRKLPPAPEIPRHYDEWRSAYRSLSKPARMTAPKAQVTNVSKPQDCRQAAQMLQDRLKFWFNSEQFRLLKDRLLEKLNTSDLIRVIIQTDNFYLRRLPWHLWDFIQRYPNAEVALSAPDYEKIASSSSRNQVRILAILGNSEGIDVKADRNFLDGLQGAKPLFLVEPSSCDIREQLWKQNWDILFFAGHSRTEGETGRIYINQTESLTLGELKLSLRRAIAQGLQLAIFNSCDGLGLAQELEDLHIPQVIVMREPVPDKVAQDFLKYFLNEFSQGESLYKAVRTARERLEDTGLESKIPGVTWLPIICQNPAEIPKTWQEFIGNGTETAQPNIDNQRCVEEPVLETRTRQFKRRDMQNRYRLLDDVKSEVENRLESSLHNAVLINLLKERQPSQVERRWDVEVKIGNQPTSQLETRTKIIEVFDDRKVAGKLLILGKPGAGKTTTLLEMASELIARAETELDEPIPILFNLSSWKDNNQTIANWMVAELKLKHGVSKELGKNWLNNQQLLPLLDGLDEVESMRQEQCIQAINQFQQDYRPIYLVVCSRLAEYEFCNTKLQLNGAVYLHFLTEKQIRDYLISAKCSDFWQSIQTDPNLLELAKSPLLLSIMTLANQEISIQKWQRFDSSEERRRYLFDAYILRMLSRKIHQLGYPSGKEPTPEITKHWLSYLAKMLKQEFQTEFLIDKMQPSWLQTRTQKRLYRAGVGLVVGLIWGMSGLFTKLNNGLIVWISEGMIEAPIVGLISGLIYGLCSALVWGLIYGTLMWLIEGVISGLIFGLIEGLIIALIFGVLIYQPFLVFLGVTGGPNELASMQITVVITFIICGLLTGLILSFMSKQAEKIRTIETLKWSNLKVGRRLGYGMVGGLIFWLIIVLIAAAVDGAIVQSLSETLGALIVCLSLGLICGAMGALFGLGGPNLDVETKIVPNQGIRQSMVNAGILTLIGSLVIGLSTGLCFWLSDQSSTTWLIYGLTFGVQGGLLGGTFPAGVACIQHFILRAVLYWRGSIPWNYARFLNYATERLLLQRVGGRYRFIHDLLREHFAQM